MSHTWSNSLVFLLVVYNLECTASTEWGSRCPTYCVCDSRRSENLNRDLKTANCSNANLSSIPQTLPRDVESLILHGNFITEIQNQLPQFAKLEELDLSRNRIKIFGHYPIFENLTFLHHLNLRNNLITTLFHGSFSGLKRLDTLLLSRNKIFSIEDHSFGGLNHLQTLDLSGNKLVSLKQAWFDSVPHLRTLNLHDNGLSSLPDKVFQSLNVLGTLSLSKNNLRRLNVLDFHGVENLQSLFLDYTELQFIMHDVLDKFIDLRVLSLSGNKFTKIGEYQFSRLPLQELTLTNLPLLEYVDKRAFHDLPHLRILQLNDNPKLSFIDGNSFEDVPMLTKLLVHNNHLLTLSSTLAKNIPSLNEVTFYHNAMQCDCNSFWIREMMDVNSSSDGQLTFSQSDKYVCDRPAQTRGKLLHSMALRNLPKTCSPTTIAFFEKQIVSEVGDRLRLDCRGIGVPQPLIYWIRPGGKVLNGTSNNIQYQLLGSGSLILDPIKLTDAGVYTCVASSTSGDSHQTSTTIKVLKKNIHVIPRGIGTNFITVTWNGTNDLMSANQYQILYREQNSGAKFERIHLKPPLRRYTINHLQPSRKYEFCIAFEHFIETLQMNCITITTRDSSFDDQGIHIYDMTTVTGVTVSIATVFVICIGIFIVKRVRRRRVYKSARGASQYDMSSMSQIPLDNLYHPQSTPLMSSPKQALLS